MVLDADTETETSSEEQPQRLSVVWLEGADGYSRGCTTRTRCLTAGRFVDTRAAPSKLFLAALMSVTVLLRREVVASIEKWAKNTCRSRTPLCPGSLLDLFVGMPGIGGISKAVIRQPFVIFGPGMEGAQRAYG